MTDDYKTATADITVDTAATEVDTRVKPYVFDEPRAVPPKPSYVRILLAQTAVAAVFLAGLYLARLFSPGLYGVISEFINVRMR
ncbi:hypothetical protein FACS1894133_5550 [Clostridia bacterium]|nr:hypothetical protein FACS1894133_5550 [Clostridia bacterium]